MQPALLTPALRTIPIHEVRPGMTVRDPNALSKEDILVADIGQSVYSYSMNIYDFHNRIHTFPLASTLALISNTPPAVLPLTKALTDNHSFPLVIGSDPEVFVVDDKNQVIPAFTFLGPKTPISEVFFDGFQAEFTTSPEICLGILTDRIREGLDRVLVAARKKYPSARLSHASVLDIPLDDPTLDPEHYILGCAPSENVYGEPKLQVTHPHELPFRFAGWHMHFSVARSGQIPFTRELVRRGVRVLDAILGVALVSLGDGYTDRRRRQFYGRAGEYRFGKTLEYRVPDVVIGVHPATFNLAWDLGRSVLCLGLKGFAHVWQADEDEIRACINEYDVPLARKILLRNEKVLLRLLENSYGYYSPKGADLGFRTILEGIASAVENPADIEHNWYLDRTDWILEVAEKDEAPPPIRWRWAAPILAKGQKV